MSLTDHSVQPRPLARPFDGQKETTFPFLPPAAQAVADLTPHDCRWPTGALDDETFHFCGVLRRAGSAYCAIHHRLSRKGGAL